MTWRLLPLQQGDGVWQMALDRWLFQRCHQGLLPPTLRFYTWSGWTLSLGYHQHHGPSHWQTLHWQGVPIPLVRRPTGGRAVLHGGDLSYALVLPGQSSHRRQTYATLCQILTSGWRSLGVELRFGAAGQGYRDQANCFGCATTADLTLTDGTKVIGSAQAWRGQTVLQHGSMQLMIEPELERLVFGRPTGNDALRLPSLPHPVIEQHLVQAAREQFQVQIQVQPLSAAEHQQIQQHVAVIEQWRDQFDSAPRGPQGTSLVSNLSRKA
ncbi:MAG: biotin/lipoate A/B protein ligase family protein [Nodosilinea sp.]